jgi:hypothetical protein
MLIVAAIACGAVALATSAITYKYAASHYQLIIKDNELKQQTALAQANTKVLNAERENNNVTAKLENEAIAFIEPGKSIDGTGPLLTVVPLKDV